MNALSPRCVARPCGLPLVALLLLLPACKASNSHPVRDGGTTPVTKKGDGGAVQITASVNNCPTVIVAASPPDAKIGEQIVIGATATDPDPGARLTFAWSVGMGSIGDATAANTIYTCASAAVGPQTLVVTVSDGQCTVTQKASIYCFAAGPGGGSAGSGVGGAGGSGGVAGTGGTGGGTANGGRSGTGGAGGLGGASSGAGGAGGKITFQTCNGDVAHDQDEGPRCEMCTTDNCFPGTDGCQGLDDAKTALCLKLYCCIRANQCTSGGDPRQCWCGTADLNQDCVLKNGAANGPCLKEVQAAAESNDAATIDLRFVDPNYAIGRAVNLSSCRGSFCGPPSTTPDENYQFSCAMP